jgi:hypothetical protein
MVSRSLIRLSTAPSRCDSSALRAGMHATNRGPRATGRDVRTNPGWHGTRAGSSGAGKSGTTPGRWVLALRPTFGKRQEGLAHREVLPATWEGKPLKGKPHRRYRHETGPEGSREEQGVKRLRKPVDAAQPGEASLVWVASRYLMRHRGENLMRGVASATIHRGSYSAVEPKSMRGCAGVSRTWHQERSYTPQRSVRKTKAKEGGSNQAGSRRPFGKTLKDRQTTREEGCTQRWVSSSP